jgi:hypothetical protein
MGPSGGQFEPHYTDRPEVTEAIVWAKQWQGTRWSRESGSRTRNTSRPNSGTSGSPPGPTRTRCTILLRVPKGLRQRFGSPGLVLLGHLGVDGGRLDAGVAELLLDDFQFGAAGPKQMGGVVRIGFRRCLRERCKGIESKVRLFGQAAWEGGDEERRGIGQGVGRSGDGGSRGGRGWRVGRPRVRFLAKNIAGGKLFPAAHLAISPSGSGLRHSARLSWSTPPLPVVSGPVGGGSLAHGCPDPGVPEHLAPRRPLHWAEDVKSWVSSRLAGSTFPMAGILPWFRSAHSGIGAGHAILCRLWRSQEGFLWRSAGDGYCGGISECPT